MPGKTVGDQGMVWESTEGRDGKVERTSIVLNGLLDVTEAGARDL
jgi:hypothetical protein